MACEPLGSTASKGSTKALKMGSTTAQQARKPRPTAMQQRTSRTRSSPRWSMRLMGVSSGALFFSPSCGAGRPLSSDSWAGGGASMGGGGVPAASVAGEVGSAAAASGCHWGTARAAAKASSAPAGSEPAASEIGASDRGALGVVAIACPEPAASVLGAAS